MQEINLTMDASHVTDIIVSLVKKSKLNFHITESPFSLLINLRKTFIKDKNGNSLVPLSDIFGNVVNNEVKVEEEKSRLNVTLGKIKVEGHGAPRQSAPRQSAPRQFSPRQSAPR